jgi:hypothetical protein
MAKENISKSASSFTYEKEDSKHISINITSNKSIVKIVASVFPRNIIEYINDNKKIDKSTTSTLENSIP